VIFGCDQDGPQQNKRQFAGESAAGESAATDFLTADRLINNQRFHI